MARIAALALNAVFANCYIVNSFSFGTLASVAGYGSLVGQNGNWCSLQSFLVGDGNDSLIWVTDIGLLDVEFVIGYGKDVEY